MMDRINKRLRLLGERKVRAVCEHVKVRVMVGLAKSA
jgi:hypothetical protein